MTKIRPSLSRHFKNVFHPARWKCFLINCRFRASTPSTPSIRVDSSHPRERRKKKVCVVTKVETDRRMHHKGVLNMLGAYGLLMHVASRLFPSIMATGLFAFSSRYNQSWNYVRVTTFLSIFPLLSERSGRRTPPAKRSFLRHTTYTINIDLGVGGGRPPDRPSGCAMDKGSLRPLTKYRAKWRVASESALPNGARSTGKRNDFVKKTGKHT